MKDVPDYDANDLSQTSVGSLFIGLTQKRLFRLLGDWQTRMLNKLDCSSL